MRLAIIEGQCRLHRNANVLVTQSLWPAIRPYASRSLILPGDALITALALFRAANGQSEEIKLKYVLGVSIGAA
jgi:hypothetical protein